jgi:hypothetical protein
LADDDGRPITHNLDVGRILGTGPDWAILRSGIGPRLIRLSRDTRLTFEGSETTYADDAIVQGDWAEVAGETLTDYSLQAEHVTLNALGNLIGILASATDEELQVFARSGRERGAFEQEVMHIAVRPDTQFYAGRGNFDIPNRSLAELKSGSWVMCDGYRTRDGAATALKCYFGNELPPDDAPVWLLDLIRLQ